MAPVRLLWSLSDAAVRTLLLFIGAMRLLVQLGVVGSAVMRLRKAIEGVLAMGWRCYGLLTALRVCGRLRGLAFEVDS